MNPVLQVCGLRTEFKTERGNVRAVDGVNLQVGKGQTVGIVGESGCGKTMLALSVMRLVPTPAGRIVDGQIILNGRNLVGLPEDEMRSIRGREISMIFQEPMTSLNPVFRVGEQISEVFRLHRGLKKKEARDESIEMIRMVGIPSPDRRINDYPHQMSGGMRQRVMIAMALACRPRIMLADEPTTALDVTIQSQVMELISKLRDETGTAVILITHDLGIIAEVAETVAVMYAGQIVEQCSVRDLFCKPLHPYTIGLLESVPRLDGPIGRDAFLKTIPGMVPPLYDLPIGCYFRKRCPDAFDVCGRRTPVLEEIVPGHDCRCWKYRVAE